MQSRLWLGFYFLQLFNLLEEFSLVTPRERANKLQNMWQKPHNIVSLSHEKCFTDVSLPQLRNRCKLLFQPSGNL